MSTGWQRHSEAMRRMGYKAGREGQNPAFTPYENQEYTIGWMNGAADRAEMILQTGCECGPNDAGCAICMGQRAK